MIPPLADVSTLPFPFALVRIWPSLAFPFAISLPFAISIAISVAHHRLQHLHHLSTLSFAHLVVPLLDSRPIGRVVID